MSNRVLLNSSAPSLTMLKYLSRQSDDTLMTFPENNQLSVDRTPSLSFVIKFFNDVSSVTVDGEHPRSQCHQTRPSSLNGCVRQLPPSVWPHIEDGGWRDVIVFGSDHQNVVVGKDDATGAEHIHGSWARVQNVPLVRRMIECLNTADVGVSADENEQVLPSKKTRTPTAWIWRCWPAWPDLCSRVKHFRVGIINNKNFLLKDLSWLVIVLVICGRVDFPAVITGIVEETILVSYSSTRQHLIVDVSKNRLANGTQRKWS